MTCPTRQSFEKMRKSKPSEQETLADQNAKLARYIVELETRVQQLSEVKTGYYRAMCDWRAIARGEPQPYKTVCPEK